MASLLTAPIRAQLNPFITGPLYWLLTSSPPRLRMAALVLSSKVLPDSLPPTRLAKILRVLFALGIARQVALRLNARLNAWATNGWVWRAERERWVWLNEVAVVTGGCSGIGAAIVRGLTAKGVKVAVLDVQKLPSDLERSSRVSFFECDVTSPDSIAAAASQVRSSLGNASILVNNAGIGSHTPILKASAEQVTKIFQINIISHFWLVKEFMPSMVQQNKGHVVEIASMASFVSAPGITDYSATKAGVMAFYEGLLQEIKHIYKTPGVKASIIHPHWVRTPLTADYADHLEKTQGKLMTPEHIGERVVKQIVSCKGGQVVIPSKLSVAAAIRGYPNWVQQVILDASVGRSIGRTASRQQ